jgi:hypothetical protein
VLDQIPKETDPAIVSKMLYTMVDEHLSTRDLEPMINGQWADQVAEILRCDRSYRDAADSLAQFNQEKDRITCHADTKLVDVDLKARQMGSERQRAPTHGLEFCMDEPRGLRGPLSSQTISSIGFFGSIYEANLSPAARSSASARKNKPPFLRTISVSACTGSFSRGWIAPQAMEASVLVFVNDNAR